MKALSMFWLGTALLISGISEAEVISLEETSPSVVIPVTLNGIITLPFQIDTGATDVLIPTSVFNTLVMTKTVKVEDIIDANKAKLGDGTILDTAHFKIRKLTIGSYTLENVDCQTIVGKDSALLLGLSALSKIEPWNIDTTKRTFTFNDHKQDSNGGIQPSNTVLEKVLGQSPILAKPVIKPIVITAPELKLAPIKAEVKPLTSPTSTVALQGPWLANDKIAYIKDSSIFISVGFPTPDEATFIFCYLGTMPIQEKPKTLAFTSEILTYATLNKSKWEGTLISVDTSGLQNIKVCWAGDMTKSFLHDIKHGNSMLFTFKLDVSYVVEIMLDGAASALNSAYNYSKGQ